MSDSKSVLWQLKILHYFSFCHHISESQIVDNSVYRSSIVVSIRPPMLNRLHQLGSFTWVRGAVLYELGSVHLSIHSSIRPNITKTTNLHTLSTTHSPIHPNIAKTTNLHKLQNNVHTFTKNENICRIQPMLHTAFRLFTVQKLKSWNICPLEPVGSICSGRDHIIRRTANATRLLEIRTFGIDHVVCKV